jgi:hypothetical protein
MVLSNTFASVFPSFRSLMSLLSRLLFMSLSTLACTIAAAQEADPPTQAVTVVSRKNPGDIPYRGFLLAQRKLLSYLPPEPRKLDIMLRVSFTDLPLAERDAYLPQSWGVSIVGDTVDETLALRRGGYFVLPELPQAFDEDATIMFRERSRKGWVDVGWIVRIEAGGRLAYADFAQAVAELRGLQKAISVFNLGLRAEKYATYDTLKACFLDAGGQLRIKGKPAADGTVGNCALLRFDPARAGSGDEIDFAGPLEIVTVVESRAYAPFLTKAGG